MVPSAPAAQAATCWYGSCFSYVSGSQEATATGASVTMLQDSPTLDAGQPGGHSLQELALQNSAQTSTVEVGWTVDPQLNGDSLPHLFVYHWVDGQESCYNGCGFVQVSGSVRPGMAVTSGTAGTYAVLYSGGNWWIYYDNQAVGYFPGSLWGGSYTSAQLVTAFGEVAATDPTSCTQMGDGRPGSDSGSSWIADYQLVGSPDAPSFTVSATDPGEYDSGSATATSFQLGGPGGAC
ncbi:neprosin family prolyl endopeptidase [Streptacidiphilus sp. 4-A2]|nr:neprosin family prolyl endopeptidase [Streptacidiphilus sp. 4-A2]